MLIDTVTNERDEQLMAYKVSLAKGEIQRLPSQFKEIAVLSGCAWVTYHGHDTILCAGEHLSLSDHRDFAVISALGESNLVFGIASKN